MSQTHALFTVKQDLTPSQIMNQVFLALIVAASTASVSSSSLRLSVAPERKGVVSLPGLSAASLGLVVAVALVETARLLAGGGKAAGLAVFVDGVDDPVDAGILANGLVLGVDEDNLEVLVGRVLVDPVRVENTQVGAAAADTLLGGGLEGTLILELVHTLVGGLAYNTPSLSATRRHSFFNRRKR
jgi:hypothetical protein